MAIRPLNSIAGFSAGDPAVTVIQANGDVTTINFTANGISNLGPVSNVIITGGSDGQALLTDGLGNLSWQTINVESNRAAPMPYIIPTGESYIVNENFQGLYSQAITIDGELTVDGMLIEIVDTISSQDTQILFDYNGIPTGNTGFTFEYYSGNMSIPGNLGITGNIIPSANVTYNLGSNTKRWNDIWLSNSTIYIGDSSITTDANNLVLTSGTGATFEVSGNANVASLQNGNSNISIDTNGNIVFGVSGTPNVLIVTPTGVNFTGTIDFEGNIDVTGNIAPNAILTDNYLYANGDPVDFQQAGGSNTQVQFNDADTFGASANFTFDKTTNNLAVSGNIVVSTGAYYGNAAGLTNIPAANISGTVANANHAANANVANTAGTVTANAQPNITSLGTLTGLSINGNISVTGTANITDLAVSGNAVVGGNLQVNGNLIYINVEEFSVEDPIVNLNTGPNGVPPVANTGKDIGTALNYYDTQARIAFMGWDTSNAEFAFGSRVSITGEIVTFSTLGNVRGQTFIGNVEATTISGNLTTNTQSNITTVGTLGNLSVSGNITAGNVNGGNVVTANYLVSNSGCVSVNGAYLAFDSGTGTGGIFNSLVSNLNIGIAANVTIGSATAVTTIQGNLVSNNNIYANTGNIVGNLLTGTLTTAAQPNITSVGTLSSLNVSGNITANNYSANTVTTNSVISKRANVPVTTSTVVDSFPASAYRTAKYVIKSSSNIGYESLEVLLIHNDINSYITVYAAINDGGGNTVSITTGINSGNVELRATGLGSGTTINLIGTYIPD